MTGGIGSFGHMVWVEARRRIKAGHEVPELICPIGGHTMEHPVRLPCGHTFDKWSLEAWMDTHGCCQVCQRPYTRKHIQGDRRLAALLTEHIRKQWVDIVSEHEMTTIRHADE